MNRVELDNPPDLEDWSSLTPTEAGTLFRGFPAVWCIAGGWAIDLFAGGPSRPHADVDLQVGRNSLPLLHGQLPGWLLYAADGDVTPWNVGTPLPPGVHDIWCRRPGRAWEFQMMVVDLTDHEWVFRRDGRVRGPRDVMIVWVDGLPVLAPEIQLLYKSKLPNRPKDEHDLRHVLPLLTAPKREWLTARLILLYGDHPWLPMLADAPIGEPNDMTGRLP